MKLLRMFLTIAALLSISATSPVPVQGAVEQGVDAGFTVATTGLNGWYTSNLTVYAVSPVVANGKLLHPGESITVSDEGEQASSLPARTEKVRPRSSRASIRRFLL